MKNEVAAEPYFKLEESSSREPYEKPAIIYEGKIVVRAGSPVDFTGDPFNLYDGYIPPDEG